MKHKKWIALGLAVALSLCTLTACGGASGTGGAGAVSYTHLDVYKRQQWSGASSLR